MDPKELRINNYVQDAAGLETKLQVIAIDKSCIRCGDDEFSYPYLPVSLRGIPLTPELLERSGFVGHNNSHTSKMVIANKDSSSPTTINFFDGTMEIARSGIGALQFKCNYLHQLQNLFFALTQTELNIEL